ncbi:calcium proton exchanger [Pluteus cervinus]|uniref:Calcium proton exchanger n=1 Tax=Pluteus cervinus TaxID=181527 RepID=A0ACD3BEH0_9AGAR|nr:calcium proton exchanger [Pluteus cervinus]
MSRPQETTPLLPSTNGSNGHATHQEPSYLDSAKFFFLGSWFNVLLVFVPLSLLAEYLGFDGGKRFCFSFLAIMPLAKLLGVSTDQISLKLGDIQAGLLNASFGNAVEIIVGIVALLQGQYVIVQTSMLGSVLSNILLVLGCSFFAAGLKRPVSKFAATSAQTSSSMMILSCITLIIPAAYYHLHVSEDTGATGGLTQWAADRVTPFIDPATADALNFISRGTAILMLVVYVAYICYLLFAPSEEPEQAPREQEAPEMNAIAAAIGLLATTVVTSFCADVLVGSIEEFADTYHVPRSFIGLILLPIVANAAEHVTAVWMAMDDRMEMTLTICVGSSIQITTFVIPLLVVIGWVTDHPLTLFFPSFETIVLFIAMVLVSQLLQDGKSNIMEGMMLVTTYSVVAISAWVQ